jgi:pimeloyl-ACP methyl ester carboxylesterase
MTSPSQPRNLLSSLFEWLLGYLRFGIQKDSVWRPYHQVGSNKCSTAFLLLGGLSSNGALANRQLARTLHRKRSEAHTWSRNLSGHTGRFVDYSSSRFWHWISDGAKTLRKLIDRHHKDNIILIGHSTGGLVVLSLAILYDLFPKRFSSSDRRVRLRSVLIFPAFRLKRKRDTVLLSIVGLLYYFICPVAFLILAFSGPWMWPLSLLAFLLHIILVPQISVPSGEERARQVATGQRWLDVPEGVLLSLACIYFVAAPPLIAIVAGIFPGSLANTVFAVFILTLLTPIFLMPRDEEPKSPKFAAKLSSYQWMPIITVTNLIILQMLLRPLLHLVRCPVLVLIAEQDQVVEVRASWIQAMKNSPVQTELLAGFPHSGLENAQQIRLADAILQWSEDYPGSKC